MRVRVSPSAHVYGVSTPVVGGFQVVWEIYAEPAEETQGTQSWWCCVDEVSRSKKYIGGEVGHWNDNRSIYQPVEIDKTLPAILLAFPSILPYI
ncbi:MAG TPA: hypothetical protein VNN76_01025 [Bacteroidota bacterium]|nr:hypothetical protein [Bacteroidota bacterium]